MTPNTLWKVRPKSNLVTHLSRETGLSPLQSQLLINRGIVDPEQAEAFLNPRLADMADPMLLKGMDVALAMIIKAIEDRKKITIFGDYDADGVTATALLLDFFSILKLPVEFYIPNRLEEGYGLSKAAVERIAGNGTQLIITVDCGISNLAEISFARSLGIDVVVTDHHQPDKDFRIECPVLNPHQKDCGFPFKNLAGVGLAFFLAVAIRTSLRKNRWFRTIHEPDLKGYLDLVALGTVADRVPLVHQNRIMVAKGIEVLAASRREGIRALKQSAGIAYKSLDTDDLAFKLAPRLNAPGRMGNPETALRILTVQDAGLAKDLASELNAANSRRQGLEQHMLEQAEKMIGKTDGIDDRKILFMGSENWHKGVLGIVASRLLDKYHRPSFIFSIEDEMAVASGRSVDGFHLYEALSSLHHLLNRFGGHSHAAGFAFRKTHLDILARELEHLAEKKLGRKQVTPTIEVDAEIPLKDITYEMLNQINALSPFGDGNPEPLFLTRGLEVIGLWVIGEKHLKIKVRKDGKTFDAIGFNLAEKLPHDQKAIDMLFTPELNNWQGYERIQLRIKDLKLVT